MKHAEVTPKRSFAPRILLFVLMGAAWLAFDRVTKIWADGFEPGTVFVENIAGLFEFRLVHNTGAAWGIFSNSTFALGIFSLAVCVIMLIMLFTYVRSYGDLVQAASLSLVFAGGLGNAIDRLSLGYVIDFIKTTFIDFPVFNVADIGVTCGI
ncbi:MAG: signal peptidase II, partial [Eggerthellaceae bacterium]|nr:signal peptidase II [Eggerthellaceae bacterium]